MARLAFLAAVFAAGVLVALAIAGKGAGDSGTDTTGATSTTPETVTVTDPVTARKLARANVRLLAAHRRVRSLKRTLLHQPSTAEAIELACSTYGSCTTLWRRARCESRLDPTAHNPSGASGLFQFLPSTFASTPYGRQSIFSPYANALAAGWMQAHGHGGEWTCQ